jgi:hypothetical protein
MLVVIAAAGCSQEPASTHGDVVGDSLNGVSALVQMLRDQGHPVTARPEISAAAFRERDAAIVFVDGEGPVEDAAAARLESFLEEPGPQSLFLVGRDGDWGVLTYEFEDVVKTLNGVHAYDWASFLKTRIQTPGQPAPLNGIERGGYRLAWKDEPNPYDRARMAAAKYISLNHSIGLAIDNDGKVSGSRWDGPGFKAGIVTGMQIVSVNGKTYDQETLKAAITAAKGTDTPIELIVKRDDVVRTVQVPYHDGLRWPWLERAAPGAAPTGLDKLLAPRAPAGKKPAMK